MILQINQIPLFSYRQAAHSIITCRMSLERYTLSSIYLRSVEQYRQICWRYSLYLQIHEFSSSGLTELHSPKYQEFLTDKLLHFKPLHQAGLAALERILSSPLWQSRKTGSLTKASSVQSQQIPYALLCGAPHEYLYDNSGGRWSVQVQICGQTFVIGEKVVSPLKLQSYCGHSLQPVKDRKHFRVHKCVNDCCSYYKRNLKKCPRIFPPSEYWKSNSVIFTGSFPATFLTWT